MRPPNSTFKILGNILEKTKIPFELSVVMKGADGLNWGSLSENGTYMDGIQGDVEHGRVDSVCAFYQMTPNRINHFDFTIPVTESESDVIRLISRGLYKLVVTSTSSWFVDNLKFSADPFFVELRIALVYASADEAVRLVQRGDHILQMVEDSSVVEKMASICFVVLFSQGLPRKGAHFILPKASPWIPFLNEQITLTNSFNEFTYRRYFEERSQISPRVCESSWISQATGANSALKALSKATERG
ncbi:hypothetical protein PENTCL1PPCAC_15894, partial [Pristionchus entomophagus]